MPQEAEGHEHHDATARPRRSVRQMPTVVVMIVYLLAGLLIVSLLQGFGIVRVFSVPSGSMLQTLGVGDRILLSGLPYGQAGPARGDVVVFSHGDTWDDETRTPASNPLVAAARTFGDLTGIGSSNKLHTVKRVVGLPGQTVACCDDLGRVTVDGVGVDEPYVFEDEPFRPGDLDCRTPTLSSRCFAPIVVPKGTLLVMGDHRSNSADSVVACRGRAAGADCAVFVDESRVVGKVFAKAWPPGPVR